MNSIIQDRLNKAFRDDNGVRKIIFWYDEKGEFEEKISRLVLDNAKLCIITKSNKFSIKNLLERKDKESNFLLYAPFKRPADSENSLADIIYYSEQFYADNISLVAQELGIPENLKNCLKIYEKFWNAKYRVDRFKALNITEHTEDKIGLGILAVLSGVHNLKFNSVLKKVIITPVLENKILSEFKKYSAEPVFWKFCESEYGYKNETPTLEKLIRTLFVTDLYQHLDHDLRPAPKAWGDYFVKNPDNISNIIQSIRENSQCLDIYDEIANDVQKQLNIEKHFEEIPLEACIRCDTFEYFDQRIIDYLTNYLVNNKIPFNETFRKNNRMDSYHYSHKYGDMHAALYWAAAFIGETNVLSKEKMPVLPEEIVTEYTQKWYAVDLHYRKFYESYDKIKNHEEFRDLRHEIEKRYIKYLEDTNTFWSESLIKNVSKISELHLIKQSQFYQKFIEEDMKRGTVVVIISDAFRYECANEFLSGFEEIREKISNIKCEPAISTVPSYTALGMAALLPHEKITLNPLNDYEVKVNDLPTRSLGDREKILSLYSDNAIALNYDNVITKNRKEIRDILTGKSIIYIYHNKIDARGDNKQTENEVFSACADAQIEIRDLILKLTTDRQIINYIVTADHGFLYVRDSIPESSKIDVIKQENISLHKRFILGTEENQTSGTLHYSLEYLGEDSANIYATVPYGIDIFKKQGGGSNYVHGGFSLQEIVVPVVSIKTNRDKTETEQVQLILLSKPKVTNTIEFIEFMQNKVITDNIKSLNVKLYFENSDGDKISNETAINVSNKTEQEQFRVKFTFRDKEYSKERHYYLVMCDTDADIEINRIPYIIDIAFKRLL